MTHATTATTPPASRAAATPSRASVPIPWGRRARRATPAWAMRAAATSAAATPTDSRAAQRATPISPASRASATARRAPAWPCPAAATAAATRSSFAPKAAAPRAWDRAARCPMTATTQPARPPPTTPRAPPMCATARRSPARGAPACRVRARRSAWSMSAAIIINAALPRASPAALRPRLTCAKVGHVAPTASARAPWGA